MNWFREHLGGLAGGGAAGGGAVAILGVMFKDSIRQWLDDWKDERRSRRAERMAHVGKDDRLPAELIKLLTEDIKAQRENDRTVRDLLTQMVVANERSLDVQRVMSNQFQDFDRRLGHIEGARGIS